MFTRGDQAATLADFPRRRNSLNAIRLVLAVLVIVSHSWPIGRFGDDPKLGDVTLGTFAVAGFFAISGWLITESRLNGSLRGFVWRRTLRIYPGYLAALVVVGFAMAPLGAWLAGQPYRLSDGVHYVRSNLTLFIVDWKVGETLPPTAYPTWNGALWTLWSEALCYVVVGLLVTVVGRRLAGPFVVLMFAFTTFWVLAGDFVAPLTPVLLYETVNLLPFFFAGAALFALRSWIPLHDGIAIGAGVLLGLGLATDVHRCALALPVAYVMLWAGARLPLTAVGRRNDLSYGMYIYGFPTQQLLAIVGVPTALGVGGYVVAGVLCTIPLAAASWWLVERPAQRLRGLFDPPRAERISPAPSAPPAGTPSGPSTPSSPAPGGAHRRG